MNSSSATGGSELSLLAAFPRHGAAAPVTILHAAGSLADLVRLSPVIEALDRRGGVRQIVVHSAGAPANRDPSLAQPDRWLNVHAAAEGERTAQMLHGFEQVLLEDTPDVVLVCGASNAALACALAAAKQGLPVARLEAGLRGPVADAPRNINRVLTDRLADTLLTPTWDAAANLVDEGIPDTRISAVGNTAIDVLHRHERAARAKAVWERLAAHEGQYVLVVLRGDQDGGADGAGRDAAIEALIALAARDRVVLSMPGGLRPWAIEGSQIDALKAAGVRCATPGAYLDHLSLQAGAGAVVTDIGAIQDDASALGVPCFTLADGTDRPATLAHGTNTLIGPDPAALLELPLLGAPRSRRAIPLWDGFAGERAAQRLVAHHVLVASSFEL